MADERGVIRRIEWRELCPWLLILKSFRLAVGMRVLVLAFAGLIGSAAGWGALAMCFQGSSDAKLQEWMREDSTWPTRPVHAPLPAGVSFPSLSPDALVNTSMFSATWRTLSRPFERLFEFDLTFVRLAYLVIGCLWTLVVWALFGGAIVRLSAVALAREDRLGLKASLGFAQRKWFGLFAAPLFPFIGVLLATIPLFLWGLLCRLDFFLTLNLIVWPLVLVAGAFMAVVVLGLLFGWPLMWGTIGTEGTDAFDALSRSYNYIRERPLHYLFYILVAAALGAVGGIIVLLFAEMVINLGTWGVSWGMGIERVHELKAMPLETDGSLFSFGRTVIGFWNGCVLGLFSAFLIGYFWTAMTAVYLLMRQKVDATELDEVYVEDEEQGYGMPPLAAGVPKVADAPPAEPAPPAEEQE